MATRTSTIGSSGQVINLNNYVDTGITMAAGEYPTKVTLTLKQGGGYWYNSTGTAKVIYLDLCGDTTGTIVQNLQGWTVRESYAYTPNEWTVSNGTNFTGKKLYLHGHVKNGGSTDVKFKNAVPITITTNYRSYTLTVAKGTGIASTTGGGSVKATSSTAISATASAGYTFSNWTSNNGGSFANANAASTTFTMPAKNVTVTASANINSYTLTVSKGTGISSVSGGGTKNYGSSNAISATVSTGYTFNKWTSNNGGSFANANSASTNFTMPAGNVTVTASATVNSYTLTVSKGTGISSVSGGGSKNYGSSNAISATVATGYTFNKWTSNNGGTFANANAASTTFTMPAGNVTVTASATINSYTLTVAKGTGGDSVSGGGTKNYGSSNAISATALTGYSFSNWTSNNGGTFANANAASTTFTMPAGNVTVTANFTHNSYTITPVVSPSGGGTITLGSASAYYNDTVSITAVAAIGYTFSGWTTTGGTIADSTSASTSITMPNNNVTVTASFTHNSYTLSSAVSPSGCGSVALSKSTAYYNDSITITATPATGYSFSGWTTTGGTITDATAASTTLLMPAENATVTATFVKNTYTVTVIASPNEGGTVTGNGTYEYGSTVPIAASPSSGYSFTAWDKSAGVITDASSASTSFIVPASNALVTAIFEYSAANGIKIESVADDFRGGKITEVNGYYEHSSTINLTASVNQYWQFTGWTATHGTFSDSSALTTVYTAPSTGKTDTITAHFSPTHLVYPIDAGDVEWTTGNGTLTLRCNMVNTTEITGSVTSDPATLVLHLGIKNDEGDDD